MELPASTTQPHRRTLALLNLALFLLALALPFTLLVLDSLHEAPVHDEFLSYWVDHLPSFGQILAVQLHYPLSLEPPLFHLLTHVTLGWFSSRELGLRFVSVLSYTALQSALFCLVRRIAGVRAGILAAILPGFTVAFLHGYQGRPYALLLALSALSLLAWAEGKAATTPRSQKLWNVALAAALLLTEQTHFFGVLMLLPLTLAELLWIRSHRRADPGAALALLFGYAALSLLLPFARVGQPWRVHNFPTPPTWQEIYRSYYFFLFGYRQSNGQWHLPLLATAFFAFLAAIALWRWRRPRPSVPSGLLPAIAVVALFPVVGHILAVFVTHHMEFRYVLAAIAGLTILAALALATPRHPTVALALIATLLAVQAVTGIAEVHRSRYALSGVRDWVTPTPAVARKLATNPEQPIYTADIGSFLADQMYLDDPALKHRLVLVYDFQAEMATSHTDIGYLSTLSMTHFLPFRIEPASVIRWDQHPLIVSSAYYPDFLNATLAQQPGGAAEIGPGFAGIVKTTAPRVP